MVQNANSLKVGIADSNIILQILKEIIIKGLITLITKIKVLMDSITVIEVIMGTIKTTISKEIKVKNEGVDLERNVEILNKIELKLKRKNE